MKPVQGSPMQPGEDLLAGQYRLGRLLGEGGAGLVYEAVQLPLGRTVAVKLLRAGEVDLERFRREAQVASRLNHPNAIAIYDFGVSQEGVPYLAMELARGDTLGQLLTAGCVAPGRAVSIARQVLAAIDEAHACDVVHRDLKPDNVLVHCRGGVDQVKVIDFGLARLQSLEAAENTIAGTPGYMAPEQITGCAIGPAADIYAVGVLLYEMVVGRAPFAGANLKTVLERSLDQTPEAPRELAPQCPLALSELIMTAMNKAPKDRPGSARTLRAELLASLGCPACGVSLLRLGRYCVECGTTLNPLAVDAQSCPSPTGTQRDAGRVQAEPVAVRDLASSPLIGRESTVEQLAALMVGEASPAAVALVGPAGAGKARIIAEAASRASERATVIIAGPDPSGQRDAWYPILAVLEAALGLQGRVRYSVLRDAVLAVGLPARDVPGLAELFGVPGPLEGVELAVRRRETLAAARRAIAALGHDGQHHATVCFTDIDQYDAPSLSLLAAILGPAAVSGVGLVLSSTERETVPKAARIIEVGGLLMGESFALALALATEDAQFLPSPEQLQELSGGLPGTIEQVVAGSSEAGDAQHRAGLADLVSERISRLDAHERRALQAIAVFGERATDHAVRAVLDKLGARDTGLERICVAGLAGLRDHSWSLASSLIARVALASAPVSVRRRLHRCALEVLEEARTGVPLRLLSHHADSAGDSVGAFSSLMAAGEEAVRRFDDAGGKACFGRAVVSAREMIAAGLPGADHKLVQASVRLADTLRFTGEVGLAAGVIKEASGFATELLDRAIVLRTRARVATTRGLYSVAGELYREAIGLGLKIGDREFLCETYVDLAGVLVVRGEPEAAAQELAEAIEIVTLWEGLGRRHSLKRLWLLGYRLAQLQLAAGQVDAAEETALGALCQAGDPSAPQARARLYALLAEVCSAKGNRETELSYRAQAIEGLEAVGDRQSTAELLLATAEASRELPLDPRRQSSEELIELARQLAGEVAGDPRLSFHAA